MTRSQMLLAAALAAASGAAFAQAPDRFTLLTTPESRVRAGIGFVDEDAARFGQYRGLTESGTYALLDADLAWRDNATGTWLTLYGRNLGLDSREAAIQYRRQGQWRFYGAWDETPRVSPYVVNTGLLGVGGTSLAVQAQGFRDTVPETVRRRGTLGLERQLAEGLTLQVNASSERKEGTRPFGRGNFGAAGASFNYLAEPIDRTTHALDASLGYVGARVRLQAGYRGELFDNHAPSLAVTGGGATLNGAGVGTFSPIALPPGSQSHHAFLSGSWDAGPGSTLRGNFKASYTRALQDEAFVDNPPGVLDTATTGNISGRRSLSGRRDTVLLQAGLSARPLANLDLNGSLRYEDRDEKTPLERYITVTGPATTDGFNEPRDVRYTTARGTAGYRLPEGYKLVGTVELERQDRNTSDVRVVAHRARVEEALAKLELRRAFSETVNGTLAWSHARRDGSDFVFTTRLDGTAYSNLVAPAFLADRTRDKVRVEADWQVAEPLGVQAYGEYSRDRYDTRGGLGLGLRRGESRFVAVDAAWTIDPDWKLTAWASHGRNAMAQSTTPNAAANPATPAAGIVQFIWSADLDLRSNAVGLGLRGQPWRRLRLGADVQVSRDRSRYDLAAVTGSEIPTLPAIAYDATTWRLWSLYEVTHDFGVRFDFEHDRRKVDDWTWRNFVYTPGSDGTTVATNPNARVNFVALSAWWKFR